MKYRILGACLGGFLMSATGLAATVPVTIDNYAFSPKTVTVHPGDTILWTNKDAVAHTVTALGGAFDSGAIDPGKTYRFAFTKAGIYAYRCAVHPEMRATVMVKP